MLTCFGIAIISGLLGGGVLFASGFGLLAALMGYSLFGAVALVASMTLRASSQNRVRA